MVPLGTVDLPGARDVGGSSSLAFDGEVFYYTLANGSGAAQLDVQRVRVVRAGLLLAAKALPPLRLAKGTDPFRLNYDATAYALSVEVSRGKRRTVSYDLRTGRSRTLFGALPNDDLFVGTGFDWSTRRYVGLSTAGLAEYDATGKKRGGCTLTFDGASTAGMLPSGIAATGTGLVMIQAEDDTTITLVDRRCRTVATYAHRTFAESTDENDQMACDGVTFGRPAVWVRDTDVGSMTAYALPDATCPLPTRVSVAPARARAGSEADVCATLRRAEVDRAVGNAVLSFSVAGVHAGTSTTDARGRACLALPVDPGRRAVAVSFPGTSAWARSASSGALTGYVPAAPPPPPARPRPAPPQVAHRPVQPYYGVPAGHAPLPVSVVQPAPPAPLPPAVQPAPLPNLQPVAGLAAAPGEGEAQMAYAGADDDGERTAAQLLGAAAVTAMAAGSLRRRSARAFAGRSVSGGR
jgi:hypothetical protein